MKYGQEGKKKNSMFGTYNLPYEIYYPIKSFYNHILANKPVMFLYFFALYKIKDKTNEIFAKWQLVIIISKWQFKNLLPANGNKCTTKKFRWNWSII